MVILILKTLLLFVILILQQIQVNTNHIYQFKMFIFEKNHPNLKQVFINSENRNKSLSLDKRWSTST